jgi:hypothetical protein
VWDNLAGPKTPDLGLGLCAHGGMPLSTAVLQGSGERAH